MSMRYNQAYIETHDIDWFCMIGNTAIHCASNGGRLPDKVNNREQNIKNQVTVAKMADVLASEDDVEINSEYVKERFGGNEGQDLFKCYVSSFVAMAMKGFISFDRLPNKEEYIWIAKPRNPVVVEIETLPRYDEGVCPGFNRTGELLHVKCLDRTDDD